jgi:N-acyl-D-aspartate/D-glutamate deacylase
MFFKNKIGLRIRITFVSFLLCLSVFILGSCSSSFDIVIRGGMIYDGSGGPPFKADIGIEDGDIKAIGTVNRPGKIDIDAQGLYISPGFIDIHTHCDRGLVREEGRSAKNYLTQGVTTVVTGNCGGGTYDVEEFFGKLNASGTGPNVIHLIGHGTVRSAAMGREDKEPSEEELARMKEFITQGMEEGAFGFSTGLFYAPGSYAKTEEVIELAKVVKKFEGIYTTHIRDESSYTIGLIESIREAISIGEQAGIPVQISHIKALGRSVWGLASEVSEIIENARKRGVRVYADQYPYAASSTGLSAAIVPRWVQAGGQMKDRLNDPELLPGIKKEIAENIDRRGGPESLVIVSFPKNRDFDGKSLLEISEIVEMPVVETAVYLVLEGSPSVISFNMQESDVRFFMRKPYVMTGSDGSVQNPGSSFSHPRNYGAFPRKIRKYVIEEKVISMEEAVRAATSLPAEVLGLADRGKLKEGFAADIVIFDPEKITDKATFESPHKYSEGIQFLLVNGEIVIEDGGYNGKLAGKPIKKNQE